MNKPVSPKTAAPAWLLAVSEAESADLGKALPASARDAIRELISDGESANTRRSYRGALRYWAAWHRLRLGAEIDLPVPAATVLRFIVDHVERQTPRGPRSEMPESVAQALAAEGFLPADGGVPSLATLLHRISVLSKAHQWRDLPNPCQVAEVRALLAATRRSYAKRGLRADKKAALTREPLEALLATCDNSLRGVRDRALLLFAWSSGGRRRSEVVAATTDNVIRQPDGSYLYTLGWSKTNQSGAERPDQVKPVLGRAAQALDDWLMRSQIGEGALFRRIRRGDHVAEPLSAAAVRDIVKLRSTQAGLPEDFSAHSLRSGFVTEAGRRGMPLGDTMALTGHTSVVTVMGYFRAGTAARNPAARLLDDDEDEALGG